MTRRSLILAAVALLCGCQSEIETVRQMIDDARIVARIGVLANTEIAWMNGTGRIEQAFRYFRAQKADAVVIAGEPTKDGYADQYKVLEQLFAKVFKGVNTKLIYKDGDHEVNGFKFATMSSRPYMNCERLTFYGGRKLSLTDELCIHPRDSRAICAGSMRGIEVPDGIDDEKLRQCAAAAAQGLFVSVYSGETVIRRLDFTTTVPEDVGEPWRLSPDGIAPMPPETPQFWPDTKVQVLGGYVGADAVYTVKWPSVLAHLTGARARWYEVRVAYADNLKRTVRRRTVMSDGFFLGEHRDLTGVKCTFKLSELPESSPEHSKVVFEVTPIGCFGRRGNVVRSAPVDLR